MEGTADIKPGQEGEAIPNPLLPIAVRAGNPAEETFRVIGFPDLETAREYARRRARANMEVGLRPNPLDPKDVPVDAHGRVVLPSDRLRLRASFGGEWVEVENDGWNPRETELDHFLAHPATPEEMDYRVMEEQLGLVEWTVYSPAGTKPLPSVLNENRDLRIWFHSPFWMDQVHRSVRETFAIPEACQTLVPPGPFAMEDGTMVFFRVADTRQCAENRFPHEITVEIPLDDSLHPTGPPRAFVSDRVPSSACKNTGKPRVHHLLVLALTLLMLGVVALMIRSLLTRSIMVG